MTNTDDKYHVSTQQVNSTEKNLKSDGRYDQAEDQEHQPFYLLGSWDRFMKLVAVESPTDETGDAQPINIWLKFLNGGEESPELHRPTTVGPYSDEQKPRLDGDIVNDNPIILSQRAVDALRPMLDACGSLYPLKIIKPFNEQAYWLYEVTNLIDALNDERIEGALNPWRSDDYPQKYLALHKIVLDKTKLEGKNTDIFYTPEAVVLVNDNFVSTVKKHKLKGFTLYPIGFNMMKEDLDRRRKIYLNKNAGIVQK